MSTSSTSYSLSIINNPEFISIREITESDFDRYSKSIAELSKLSSDENLFRIVELNYIDLKNHIEEYLKMFSEGIGYSHHEDEQMTLNLNRLILNLLTSIRTYLDHTQTRLTREYGSNSDELNNYNKATSWAYDNNFSYRFLYRLRNYSQHCGLPAGSIVFNSSENQIGETVNTLTLLLIRDELLKNFNAWGKHLVKEIPLQPDKFDIIPLVESKIKLLEDLNKKTNSHIYAHFINEGNELMNLIWETENKGGFPCLIKTISKSSEHATLSIVHFPFEAISKITGVRITVNSHTYDNN